MIVAVSVVVPVHNASNFLNEAFESILSQTWKKSLEVSIFNDSSTDNSLEICKKWIPKFNKEGITVIINSNQNENPGGVGYAKNQAIKQSKGEYICFFDADDVMEPNRIECQLPIAKEDSTLIVGSCYFRFPEGSAKRYTNWNNMLSQEQLYTQIYTSFGPTIINPTWFCSREVFKKIGYFSEHQKGYPEDLDFFYRHLNSSGRVYKIDQILLQYRYNENGASFSVHEETIWKLRVEEIQRNVLKTWNEFTIWNAGKQGRKFYRSLDRIFQKKVIALCDVDSKKINKKFYTCELIKDEESGKSPKIPIVHFRDAKPPFVICVKLDLTNGEFEKNLNSLNLIEGKDYFHFN